MLGFEGKDCVILRLHTPGDNEDPSQPGAWGLTAVWPWGGCLCLGNRRLRGAEVTWPGRSGQQPPTETFDTHIEAALAL